VPRLPSLAEKKLAGPPGESDTLARLTAEHRARRAAEHEAEAEAARAAARRAEATPEPLTHERKVVKYRRNTRTGIKRRTMTRVREPAAEALRRRERWHASRARGQRELFATVEHCSEGRVSVLCQECVGETVRPACCSQVKLCAQCWKQRAEKFRADWARANAYVCDELARLGFFKHGVRKGGRLGQKHVVLTMPHVLVHDAAGRVDRGATALRRVEIMHGAWEHFRRWLGRQLEEEVPGPRRRVGGRLEKRRRRRIIGTSYSRGFEWTPGEDGMGHPHFHLWVLSPFLALRRQHEREDGRLAMCEGKECALCAKGEPFALERGLRDAWADALAHEGVEVSSELVQVHVAAVKYRPLEFRRELRKTHTDMVLEGRSARITLEDSAGEDVIGYIETCSLARLTREEVLRAGPEVLAGVYLALASRRVSQGSQVILPSLGRVGFMSLAEMLRPACACTLCGAVSESTDERDGIPRLVRVEPWFRVRDGPIKRPLSSENEGPALGLAWRGDPHTELVAKLRSQERAERDFGGELQRILLTAAAVREDPSVLGARYAHKGPSDQKKVKVEHGRFRRS